MTRLQLEHFKEQMDAAVKDHENGCVFRMVDLLNKWGIRRLLPYGWDFVALRNLWRNNPEAAHILADTHFLT